LGWVEGSNVRIDARFGAGDANLVGDSSDKVVPLKGKVAKAKKPKKR
jgi:hypothetical protein